MSHVMETASYYTKKRMGIKNSNSQGWTLKNIKQIIMLKFEQDFVRPVDNALRTQIAGTRPCG